MTVRTSNKKHSVSTKRATIVSIKVKSCNGLLCMLMVRTRSYLKSLLRHTFLIFGVCHLENIYFS